MNRFISVILLVLVCSLNLNGQAARYAAGVVVDETGLPVAGATVMVAGTQNGVSTDKDGKYSIKCQKGDVLIFNCLGYQEYRATVNSDVRINVVLRENVNNLNELVVIAYATQAKSDLTGSVAVVDMEELNKTPIISADQALQGRVAGLEVMNVSGDPGSSASMRIRGTRSINANNDPLIVVDGVVDAVESFSDINPADIK